MCDKELLVAYIYEDIGDMDRARVERHLRECAVCRSEVSAIRSVREDLALWTPTQPDLGFRLVKDRKPSWGAWWTPAFGLAAAAVLVISAASALAHVEVSYGQNGVSIRTGWNTAAAQPATPLQGSAAVDRADGGADARRVAVDATAIADFDRRLKDLEAASRILPVHQVSSVTARLSDAEILRRVRDLLAQSESRQQQELALRIAQVIRDVDAQRVADLTRIQQGFGRIDAMTTAEAATHRDLANYILTSSKQQQK